MKVIADHGCLSAFQDAEYGKGRRAANSIPLKVKGGTQEWRCTVCGKTIAGRPRGKKA